MEYSKEFFDSMEEWSKSAARMIMPYVLDKISPRSVIDFGCGEGVWLSVIKEISPDIIVQGIDGAYICEEELKIPKENFCAMDLSKEVFVNKKFDLAISLEVAEHISEEYADVFIDNICRHSDRILFSAAIPGQGGVCHLNEQFQSYWIEKFKHRGYYVNFSLRKMFWNNTKISGLRRQNILYFSKYKEDFNKINFDKENIVDIVHPEVYLKKCQKKVSRVKECVNIRKVYECIEYKIKELVDAGNKNIVICPFGNHGFLCKEILNYKYNIKEYAIIDNEKCKKENGIISSKEAKKLGGNYVILINCWDINLQKELLKELQECIAKERIVCIFENQ